MIADETDVVGERQEFLRYRIDRRGVAAARNVGVAVQWPFVDFRQRDSRPQGTR
jgi:hypothetical protein